jgi:transcriptional regulator NrdR family protein
MSESQDGLPPKVPCPSCHGRTLVYDSRGVHRRRVCIACGTRFATREIVVSESRTASKAHDDDIKDAATT